MEYRPLGKTGLKVSLMGFGGIPIQRVSREEAKEIIDRAIERGINFFDSARAYTDSESKIGEAVKDKRDKIILASKTMARTYEQMKADIEKSLREFGVDYIDLYQCHNVKSQEELDKILAPGGALEALEDAKKEGKIGHLGITGHRAPVVVTALKTGKFATVQFPFNFIERIGEEEIFPLAREMNMGIIVMKPLAGGAFSKPELALRFLLQQNVSTIIPGMDSLEQVELNARLACEKQILSAEELEYLGKEAKEVGERFCRRCEYCKPCPQNLDMPIYFILHGYYERYGLPDWARERYQSLGVKADACQDCGLCESRCPYNLPIREMLKKVHRDLS